MQERLNDISILRCGAMLMIVFYHCLCPYGVWDNLAFSANFSVPIWDVVIAVLRNIHLAMFFVLAGFLFGYKRIRGGGYNDVSKFVKNKFLRVIVPYILVGLLIVFIQKEPVKAMFYGISHLWFLMTIFECYLLGRLIDGILRVDFKYKMLALLLCFIAICLSGKICIHIWALTIKQFGQFFPFYLIGMILGSLDLSQSKHRYLMGVASVISILMLFLCATIYNHGGILRILGFIFIVAVFLFMRNSEISTIPVWIKSLDRCSMGIYIVHHILIQEMNRVGCFHAMMIEWPIEYPLVQFVVITMVSWGVVLILKKNKLAKYIVG